MGFPHASHATPSLIAPTDWPDKDSRPLPTPRYGKRRLRHSTDPRRGAMRRHRAEPLIRARGLGPRHGVTEDLCAGRLGQTGRRERLGRLGKFALRCEIGRRQGFWSKTHGCIVQACCRTLSPLSGHRHESCAIHTPHILSTSWAERCLLNPSRSHWCNPL
jgi:hypothetical protein